jgi:hypothetical protein
MASDTRILLLKLQRADRIEVTVINTWKATREPQLRIHYRVKRVYNGHIVRGLHDGRVKGSHSSCFFFFFLVTNLEENTSHSSNIRLTAKVGALLEVWQGYWDVYFLKSVSYFTNLTFNRVKTSR